MIAAVAARVGLHAGLSGHADGAPDRVGRHAGGRVDHVVEFATAPNPAPGGGSGGGQATRTYRHALARGVERRSVIIGDED